MRGNALPLSQCGGPQTYRFTHFIPELIFHYIRETVRLNKNTYIADLDPFENIYISLDMLDQKAIEVLSDICP